MLDDAAVVLAAEMIGVAEAANALALDYAQAREAANRVTAECLQIHGGVGYTWDNDSHLLLRRAKVDDMLLGAQGWQRERLADAYFAGL